MPTYSQLPDLASLPSQPAPVSSLASSNLINTGSSASKVYPTTTVDFTNLDQDTAFLTSLDSRLASAKTAADQVATQWRQPSGNVINPINFLNYIWEMTYSHGPVLLDIVSHINAVKAQVSSLTAERNNLQTQLNNSNTSAITQQLNDLQSKYDALKASIPTTQAQLAEAHNIIVDLQNKYNALKASTPATQTQLSEAQTTITGLKAQINTLQSENSDCQNKLSAVQDKYNKLLANPPTQQTNTTPPTTTPPTQQPGTTSTPPTSTTPPIVTTPPTQSPPIYDGGSMVLGADGQYHYQNESTGNEIPTNTPAPNPASTNDSGSIVLAGLAALAVIGGAAWWYNESRKSVQTQEY